MTTNWDRTLSEEVARRWRSADDKTVMHLHGDFREARGMVLPTKVTFEPYRAKPDVVLMSARRRAIMTALETTDRFVIYGLSMSPLDAELVQVVTFGIECGRVTEIKSWTPTIERSRDA